MKKRVLSYEEYLDRVYGCFLGKAISGNIGAPYEGVKMEMNLPFLPLMIDCDRPNDDLDLQVLWLKEAETYGADFTSRDLLRSFSENCDYSPGEYAVMRKNYARGIYPPISGAFCNDIYREGMGCPIRSEVWACLAVGNPILAMEFSERDGSLDHIGDSIWAEKYLAVLEEEAFFDTNLTRLLNKAEKILPKELRLTKLIRDVRSWCETYPDMSVVRSKILFHYGHPDCTNLYPNMGITIASLLLGDKDIIKTSMLALNAGFDTDCTCATAGAIIGILRGGKELAEAYKVPNATYALGVRCPRRSNRIYDLAEDIAHLAVRFSEKENPYVRFLNPPKVHFNFKKKPPVSLSVRYENDFPSIAPGKRRNVTLYFENKGDRISNVTVTLKAEHGLELSEKSFNLALKKGITKKKISLYLPANVKEIYDANRISVRMKENEKTVLSDSFGIAGATPWKLMGPFWHTEPIITTEKLLAHIKDEFPYKAIVPESSYGDVSTDKSRNLHLNYMPDTETEFLSMKECFLPLSGKPSENVTEKTMTKKCAKNPYVSGVKKDSKITEPKVLYEETMVSIPEDTFYLKDLMGFKGPSTVYLSREIISPKNDSVFIQIGFSSPYELWLNGKCLAKRTSCENWTNENTHLLDVPLKKGINKLLLRLTRVNRDDCYNVTLSRRRTCGEHITTLGSKNPYYFE